MEFHDKYKYLGHDHIYSMSNVEKYHKFEKNIKKLALSDETLKILEKSIIVKSEKNPLLHNLRVHEGKTMHTESNIVQETKLFDFVKVEIKEEPDDPNIL